MIGRFFSSSSKIRVNNVMTVRPVLHRKNPEYKNLCCNAIDHSVIRLHIMRFLLILKN